LLGSFHSKSGGTLTVKVNGVVDCTYSGDTTAGLENIGRVVFGGSGANQMMDDIVMDDAAWIGNTYIQAIKPTGAGTTTSWDSTGTNWSAVDDIPASDADYNYTNVTNEIDTFETSNLTGDVGDIKCVQLTTRIAYEGSPTPTKIRGIIRSGSTDYDTGTDHAPALSFTTVLDLWETDPNTAGNPFDVTSVNALEIGYKATA